jgi:hypothetical protein
MLPQESMIVKISWEKHLDMRIDTRVVEEVARREEPFTADVYKRYSPVTRYRKLILNNAKRATMRVGFRIESRRFTPRGRAGYAITGFAVMTSVAIIVMLALGAIHHSDLDARTSSVIDLPIVSKHQYSDNILPDKIPCQACEYFMQWHYCVEVLWDDVKYGGHDDGAPGDDLYGARGEYDDCPHCSVYSGPACIQMLMDYYGGGFAPQDIIYEISELCMNPANMLIEDHGAGMTDGLEGEFGSTPAEIQYALHVFVEPYASPFFQHNQWDSSAMTPSQLRSYIFSSFPVLWDDHNGWPVNMSYGMPYRDIDAQGHYKIIGGYDDRGTPGDSSDDYAIIHDPWPEYVDHDLLPVGAIRFCGYANPYWLPVTMILEDSEDLFFVESTAIPEFSHQLIPIAGMTVIALVAIRIRVARRES